MALCIRRRSPHRTCRIKKKATIQQLISFQMMMLMNVDVSLFCIATALTD